MRNTFGRLTLGFCVALAASSVLSIVACSKSGQETQAPPAPAAQTAAPGQPAAAPGQSAAAAPAQPAATAGQPGPAAAPAGPASDQPVARAAAAPPAPVSTPAPAPPPPPPPRRFTLASGTVLSIQTNYTLSTDKQSAGDKFEASLAEPIVSGDWVVAKAGAPVDGLVVASTKGGRVKGTAQIEVAITGVTLSDGQHIRLETALAASAAKSEKKKDAGKIAVATGAGALIGAIAGGGKGAAIGAGVGGVGGTAVVLGTRGKAAEIPARSLLQFQVTKPVEIVEKK